MWWNGASYFEFTVKSMENETACSEFPSGGTAIVEQILVSEEINKSKKAEPWVTVKDSSRKVNHQVYQFHQNRLASP